MKKDYSKVNLLSKFNPPYNRFIFFFAKIFMNLSNYFHLKKFKDILVKRIYFPYNNHKIKATYYFKDSKVCSPLLIYIHGGGFAYKEATYHNDNLYLYCKEGNVDILSIDYPLINDKLFKNLNEILLKITLDILNNSQINKYSFLILGGDSAGGYLSLNLLNNLHKLNISIFKGLMLIYPVVTDYPYFTSKRKYKSTNMWNSLANQKMWNYYKKEISNIYNPFLDYLNYFPSTYLEICDLDCLKDEGLTLKDKIEKESINSLSFHYVKESFHGYDFNRKNDSFKESIKLRIQFLKNLKNRF